MHHNSMTRRLLPWRFRSVNNFANAVPQLLFTGVWRTRPIAVSRASPLEIHSLLCHRGVDMMLVAAKSLLQHCPRMALVIHDDGSLTGADRQRLQHHLPGVEIIDRAHADATLRQLLPPHVFEQRQRHVFLLKLFDFNHFNRGTHTILLDSDIVFTRRPQEILDWLAQPSPQPFYNQDAGPSYRAGVLPPELDIPPSLNAGFMGYAGRLALADIQRWCERLDYWSEDQTLYAVLLAGRGAAALDPARYVVYTGQALAEQAAMVHFISPHRFHRLLYPRLAAKVCGMLR